ncbi:MAG: hypothetical protein JKY61_12070 [Planctomycetes bacterium]|nr:hypothetical protein [Planctomycetota bacterium]
MHLHNPHKSKQRTHGMTLIEVAVALPIVLVALGMFLQMLTAGLGIRTTSGETWAASCAGQDVLELMRNQAFSELFVAYNADPMDDPGGPGTAPGSSFSVPGLAVRRDDLDGFVGEVILPFWNAGTDLAPVWQVREDMVQEDLGLPRDLNADSIVDAFDHAGDFTILPVMVRLRWRSKWGPRVMTLSTVLSEVR